MPSPVFKNTGGGAGFVMYAVYDVGNLGLALYAQAFVGAF